MLSIRLCETVDLWVTKNWYTDIAKGLLRIILCKFTASKNMDFDMSSGRQSCVEHWGKGNKYLDKTLLGGYPQSIPMIKAWPYHSFCWELDYWPFGFMKCNSTNIQGMRSNFLQIFFSTATMKMANLITQSPYSVHILKRCLWNVYKKPGVDGIFVPASHVHNGCFADMQLPFAWSIPVQLHHNTCDQDPHVKD